MSGAGIELSVVDLDKPASKLSAALWRRGGKRKEGLQLQVRPQGAKGVICELLLNFTVDTTHRLCFYTVKSSKPSFDQLINLVI